MAEAPVIVALSDSEIADFFPGSLWQEVRALLPGYVRITTPPPDQKQWHELWRQNPGSVLVSSWSTPSLNSGLAEAELCQLRYVCHLAGTVRKLVPRALIEKGVLVTNWGGSISATVAECSLMLILMALRRASYWSVVMHREGAWKNGATFTQSLKGRTVGIHGFGSISQALVPMLRPFTDKILSFSPHVPERLFVEAGVQRLTSLEELFTRSDVVVELAAATAETRHLVSEKLLRTIPEGGVFVNVGRGSVVDEEALVRVAREGKLQVALDVYETEPLPRASALRGLPNVTLLPHIGGPTRDRRRDCGELALRNLRAYFNGQPLEGVVDLEVYDRST